MNVKLALTILGGVATIVGHLVDAGQTFGRVNDEVKEEKRWKDATRQQTKDQRKS